MGIQNRVVEGALRSTAVHYASGLGRTRDANSSERVKAQTQAQPQGNGAAELHWGDLPVEVVAFHVLPLCSLETLSRYAQVSKTANAQAIAEWLRPHRQREIASRLLCTLTPPPEAPDLQPNHAAVATSSLQRGQKKCWHDYIRAAATTGHTRGIALAFTNLERVGWPVKNRRRGKTPGRPNPAKTRLGRVQTRARVLSTALGNAVQSGTPATDNNVATVRYLLSVGAPGDTWMASGDLTWPQHARLLAAGVPPSQQALQTALGAWEGHLTARYSLRRRGWLALSDAMEGMAGHPPHDHVRLMEHIAELLAHDPVRSAVMAGQWALTLPVTQTEDQARHRAALDQIVPEQQRLRIWIVALASWAYDRELLAALTAEPQGSQDPALLYRLWDLGRYLVVHPETRPHWTAYAMALRAKRVSPLPYLRARGVAQGDFPLSPHELSRLIQHAAAPSSRGSTSTLLALLDPEWGYPDGWNHFESALLKAPTSLGAIINHSPLRRTLLARWPNKTLTRLGRACRHQPYLRAHLAQSLATDLADETDMDAPTLLQAMWAQRNALGRSLLGAQALAEQIRDLAQGEKTESPNVTPRTRATAQRLAGWLANESWWLHPSRYRRLRRTFGNGPRR